MKIVIIGGNGQLGCDLVKVFSGEGHQVTSLVHGAMEVSDPASVTSVLTREQPNLVVNTAAFHDVEACETDPARAFAVNAFGPRNLAQAASRQGFRLIHVSTDYVFDGGKRQPYDEDDCPRPLNCYGNSKLSGELFVQAHAKDYAVVRVSGLYGTSPCLGKKGMNFVRLMLKLARERGEVKVVTDEFVTPTYTLAAARQISRLGPASVSGVFHLTPQGQCSWYQFAEAIFELTETQVKLSAATAADFPAKVPRPHYSVLDNKRLRAHNLDILPDWKECLRGYLKETGELRAA
jgi:dTDP-4-dehydrorhamnose reductase